VTGAHRSGTTWVANTLAADHGTAYLPELFNPDHFHQKLCGIRFPYWFMRIEASGDHRSRTYLAKMLSWGFGWHDAAAATVRSPSACLQAARVARAFRQSRARNCRPVLKDPIAIFSAEWLAEAFAMDVLVLVRHPAAFAASLSRLDWRFDFTNLLSQPSLMSTDLAPFADEIEAAARRPTDPITEAALLWKSIYATVDRYRRERPRWLFLRHEDLSANPSDGFNAICEHTGIVLSGAIANMVRRSTASENPIDAPRGVPHAVMRDSRRIARSWHRRMGSREIARLRASVEDVASRFYTDEEWLE
jgi:sulfotransferase family protein